MEQEPKQQITWDTQPVQNDTPIKGVTFDNAPVQQDTAVGQSQPQAAPKVETPHEPGFLERMGTAVKDVTEGAGAGVLDTVHGTGELIRKGLNMLPGDHVGDKVVPPSGQEAFRQLNAPSMDSPMKKIGYGGETLTEFLMGDEAFKSLSFADKLAESAKVAKLLQNSPRLMNALKMGANMSKAASELGPEEMAALKKSPVLARLVSAGMDAIRQGAVQGTQTAVRTGGDLGEAAKQGAEMTAVSGAVGAPLAAVGGTLAKGKAAANTMADLTEIAKNAPTKADIADNLEKLLKNREAQMHTDYEAGISGIKDKLEGIEVPLKGSPLQSAAQEVLDMKKGADPLDKAFAEAAPVSADAKNFIKQVANALEPEAKKTTTGAGFVPSTSKAASTTKPPYMLNADKLIETREAVLKRWRSLNWDNPDKAAYGKIIEGIDDTIDQVAKKGGQDVANQYSAIRGQYKKTLDLFRDPDAKATIRNLMGGNLKDAGKSMMNAAKAPKVIENVRQLVGQENFSKLTRSIVSDWMGEAGSTINEAGEVVKGGKFDPEKFLTKWKSTPERVREAMFENTPEVAQHYNALMQDIGQTTAVKRLVKYGIIPVTLGTTGAVHGPWAALVGAMVGLGAEGFGRASQILDYIGNHPNTWKAIEKLGNMSAEAEASDMAKSFTSAGKVGTVAAVNSGKTSTEDVKNKARVYAKGDKVGQAVRRVYSKTADVLGE